MTARTERRPAARRQPSAVRRGFDVAYGYLAAVFVPGVLVQVFFAGVGVFGFNARNVASASSFDPHRAWGGVLMTVSVILLILALAAWPSLTTVLSTFVLALLVVVAQTGLAAAGDSNKWIGGLHALDGMIILLLSLSLAIMARRRRTRAAAPGDHGESEWPGEAG